MHYPAARYTMLGLLALLLTSTPGLASHTQSSTPQLSATQNSTAFPDTLLRVQIIIIEKGHVAASDVTWSAALVADLGLDELDVIEVFLEVEREFFIKIPDEARERLLTVGQIADYVDEVKT